VAVVSMFPFQFTGTGEAETLLGCGFRF